MDELAGQQLAALARVNERFEEAGVELWLFGGWAVDLYVGFVTRSHDDLDIAVWLADVPRTGELLLDDGWRHVPSEDDDGGTGYERGAVRLELTYLVRDSDGRVCTPLRRGLVRWPDGTFADDAGELRGVRSRVVGLSALRLDKSAPRDDPRDAVKDRADFAQLSRLGGRTAR